MVGELGSVNFNSEDANFNEKRLKGQYQAKLLPFFKNDFENIGNKTLEDFWQTFKRQELDKNPKATIKNSTNDTSTFVYLCACLYAANKKLDKLNVADVNLLKLEDAKHLQKIYSEKPEILGAIIDLKFDPKDVLLPENLDPEIPAPQISGVGIDVLTKGNSTNQLSSTSATNNNANIQRLLGFGEQANRTRLSFPDIGISGYKINLATVLSHLGVGTLVFFLNSAFRDHDQPVDKNLKLDPKQIQALKEAGLSKEETLEFLSEGFDGNKLQKLVDSRNSLKWANDSGRMLELGRDQLAKFPALLAFLDAVTSKTVLKIKFSASKLENNISVLTFEFQDLTGKQSKDFVDCFFELKYSNGAIKSFGVVLNNDSPIITRFAPEIAKARYRLIKSNDFSNFVNDPSIKFQRLKSSKN